MTGIELVETGEGDFSWGSSPTQKELSYSLHPAERHIFYAHQNGCGNPDELPQKDAAVQASRRRESQSLSPVPGGSSGNSHVCCEQVEDLLSLTAEPREELQRLKSIRERLSKKEIA